jgi:hypothetical protein
MSQVKSSSINSAMLDATALGVRSTVPASTLKRFDRSSVSWLVFGPTIAGTCSSVMRCAPARFSTVTPGAPA